MADTWGVPKGMGRWDWDTAFKVFDTVKVKWAVNGFEPYKSPGAVRVLLVMLQKVGLMKTNQVLIARLFSPLICSRC